jgi:hypothetical protein
MRHSNDAKSSTPNNSARLNKKLENDWDTAMQLAQI